MSVTRVGFIFPLDKSWLGGVNYYRNLWLSIGQIPESGICPVVFMGTDHNLSDFPNLEIVRSKIFNRKSIYWFVWKISQKIFRKDFILERLLMKNKIEILSHYNTLGNTTKIKTIGWIPDFQHMHMPQLFSKKELERRNKEFLQVSNYSTKIIVSSNDALADLISFSEVGGKKAHVLQFSIAPMSIESLNTLAISELEKKYNFNGKYFMLPNQFWIHKNHQVVIDAVSKLKSRGINVQVLATGNTVDPRCPEHFPSLMQQVNFSDIKGNFKVLGIIPIKELYVLMRHAIAIINPSLFEGWSTTVEEAKSIQKKVILSDIPVHREQNPKQGEFFMPHDSEMLAKIMSKVWSKELENIEIDIKLQNATNNQSFLEFAKQYQKIIQNLKDYKA
jgi:glycosyltransferase involved in cell wall biosynthesis